MTSLATAFPSERPWAGIVRLLERDERIFAVLLTIVMVGGLAALGLEPNPRHHVDIYWLILWFTAYKVGVFALVTVSPRATRAIFTGALAVDLFLVFVLLYLTGGGYSLFYLLFFPLVAVNAYYFGPTAGLLMAVVAALLYAMAAWLLPPWVGWIPVVILVGLVGLPAFALGHVAERERRARAEVERLNAELVGTLTRLQAAQEELVVAERMATVGRLALKVAHEVRNPIAAIELNAELLGDIVGERAEAEMEEAATLVGAIRDQVTALDALTEEYLAFARFPRPHFDEDSVNELVVGLVEFVRPLATRQGITVETVTDPAVPPMTIDRTLLRQAILNLIKNGLEAMPQGGHLSVTTSQDGEAVDVAVSDSGAGIQPEVGKRLFEQFFTTKPQGTGLGLYISRQIVDEHGGELRWESRPGHGTAFTVHLPLKRSERV